MQQAQILEDNGGNIYWVLGDKSVVSDTPNAGDLIGDLALLEDWIDDIRNERPDEADTVGIDEAGYDVIAERDADGVITVYPERMGAAGKRYAKIA